MNGWFVGCSQRQECIWLDIQYRHKQLDRWMFGCVYKNVYKRIIQNTYSNMIIGKIVVYTGTKNEWMVGWFVGYLMANTIVG